MSKILETVHDTAKGLHKAGVLDATTLREFDALCLPPIKTYTPTQIRRLRVKNRASQAVFAAYLNPAPPPCRSGSRARKNPMALR